MKKTFVLLLGLVITLGAFAQEKKEYSKWSIAVEGGVNRFDGDIKQDWGRKVMPTSDSKFTVGGIVEFTPSPAWSLGLDYYYLPLSASHPQGTYSFETQMHNVSFFTNVNALKAFFPRTKTKWGLWGGVGFGFSFHSVDYKTINGKNLPPDQKYQYVTGAQGVQYADYDYYNPDGRAMFIPIHLLVEYNVSKSLAIGLKGQYRAYSVDDIDGRIRPNSNDFVELATLGLRYKFNANKKDHLRNISLADYRGDVSRDELDALQNQLDGIVIPADQSDRIDDLDRRVKKLEDILCPDGPDTDGDGVPDCRDQEPDTPEGNQVDFWGRTIRDCGDDIFDETAFVYFDFDKTNLDDEAHKAIRIAAGKLKADPTLIVEVRGFTDNMGTDEYNMGLSQRRADVVKDELIKTHGIEPDRIIANGKGKYNPSDKIAKYRPYRTCVFFYNK